ncbi:MAG: hypothetical protein WCO45_14290 [Pseudanabaena sp. ELA607]|jgi:hypothetical protein
MLIWIVIVIHCLLSAVLLWLAWQMWCLRQMFVATVVAVDSWTMACQDGLGGSPPAIYLAHQGVQLAALHYGQLQHHWQKNTAFVAGIMEALRFGRRLWLGFRPRRSETKSSKRRR